MFYVKKAPDINLICPICGAKTSWGPDIEDIKDRLVFYNSNTGVRIEILQTTVRCKLCKHKLRPEGSEWERSVPSKIGGLTCLTIK
jgi:hypothetical protein